MESKCALVFRLNLLHLPEFKRLVELSSSESINFSVIQMRQILGVKQTEVAVELAISFGVGVSSSIVASVICALLTNAQVKPINNNINVNNINVIINSGGAEEAIARQIDIVRKPTKPLK